MGVARGGQAPLSRHNRHKSPPLYIERFQVDRITVTRVFQGHNPVREDDNGPDYTEGRNYFC